jgi:myo-inositol-1(or 4)-monophosphatase
MENSSLMEVLMDFMKKAGTLALKSQENLQASLKEDASLITKVDLEISELFRHRMKKYLQSGNHCILDEENLPDAGSFFAKTTEYIWTLDPIDGTTTYYHGFPMWAVAVGLYKNLKPHLGAIYMPATQELVYTDGEKSYYIKNAFRPSAKKSLLSLHLSRNFTGKHIILQ